MKTLHLNKVTACAIVYGLLNFSAVIAQQGLPVAEVRNVPTSMHGATVNDPYRWLEDTKSAQTQSWFKRQGDVARSVLDRIEGRETLAARLAQLANAQGDAFGRIVRMPGDRYFYLKRSPGGRQFKLYMRTGLGGSETLLVDPEIDSQRTGVPHAINYFKPS